MQSEIRRLLSLLDSATEKSHITPMRIKKASGSRWIAIDGFHEGTIDLAFSLDIMIQDPGKIPLCHIIGKIIMHFLKWLELLEREGSFAASDAMVPMRIDERHYGCQWLRLDGISDHDKICSLVLLTQENEPVSIQKYLEILLKNDVPVV
ncbi:MAG: hypothetical protein ACRD5H_00600 [Nitrososphaerales archaeon]